STRKQDDFQPSSNDRNDDCNDGVENNQTSFDENEEEDDFPDLEDDYVYCADDEDDDCDFDVKKEEKRDYETFQGQAWSKTTDVSYREEQWNNRKKSFEDNEKVFEDWPNAAHCERTYSTEKKDEGNHQVSSTPIVTSEISVKYRQKGNEFYKKANDENLDPSLRKEKFKNALICYKGALKTAGKDYDSTASAAKNYAKASNELSKLLEDNDIEKRQCLIDVISHYQQALVCGKITKSALWIDDITCSLGKVLQEALNIYADLPAEEKINVYESFACSLTNGFFSDDLYVEIANLLLSQAINSLQLKNFKESKICLQRMSRPIEELKRSKTPEFTEQAETLKLDLKYNLAFTESLQTIRIGDELLESHLKDQEDLSMDMVYTVIDRYHEAMVLARDIEVEVEAIALSRLGSVYAKVLKRKDRATECFKNSIELAMSLTPRVMNDTPWYKEANDTLLKYQQKSILAQDAKREAERQKHLTELSEELSDLSTAAENQKTKGLVLHIFDKYPPKSMSARLKIPSKEDLDGLEEPNLRKFIQKMLLYYHPDKVDESEHGSKWKVLCNEITKILTSKLEVLECK
uniref:Uncharacterized protein n=2 Tax=Clytia hemisphaerica TaxID=252671 RepID=A0A7M5XJG0_9CNID